ncbi:CPBP family intramembrane glutamic endopeptidase [Heyndrickxia acidicola]|uniref:Type II CAAX endopeptidase family protein n=1 Tax=Heyndrickxia acidicola TaxID=209389 RepID=A0ABU6MFZ0_9BACI|nr:type II CAAX endopeptidase family protein [Heyndrickxia acidicola]MED1202588.1 type II CAAX endopeptidase family protein [Heyndrickxia acidicola]
MTGISSKFKKRQWQSLELPTRALLITVVFYLIAVVGWNVTYLKLIFPFIEQFILTHAGTTWSNLLSSLIGTWIGESFFPIVLYIFVVRPYQLRTILLTSYRLNLLRTLLLILFTVGVYLIFAPLQMSTNLIVLLTFIGTGFAEEYSFRGVLTRVFRDRLGIVWATVLVSILFSSAHWSEWFNVEHVPMNQVCLYFLTIFVMGVLYTVIAWRSESLFWAACIHVLNDFNAHIEPSYEDSLKFVITLMVCGVIGAELLRFVSKPKSIVSESGKTSSEDKNENVKA